jgi:multidrug efflux system membrane fusion protein
MRLIPILTALLVTGVLYLLVMERDALTGFAGRGTAAPQATAEATAEAPAEATAAASEERAVPVVTRLSVARTV